MYTLRIGTTETVHLSLVTLACAIKDVFNINSVNLINEEFQIYGVDKNNLIQLVILARGESKCKPLSSYEKMELNKIIKNINNLFPKRRIKLGKCEVILQK